MFAYSKNRLALLNWFATKHTQYSPFGEVFKASVLKEMVPGNRQYIRLPYFYTS